MKITVLDKNTMGDDLSFEAFESFGEVKIYEKTEPNERAEHIADSDVIILNKVKITSEVMEKTPNLKLVCVFATGFDNIDVVYAKEKGIAVCNVPGYSTDSVVLYTMATTLALLSHLNEYSDYVRCGSYSESDSPNKITPVFNELAGKTFGIIGCGNIGRSVLRVAEAFGARVIVYKRTPSEEFECVDIETLCRESDIITIHCPLNDSTRNLINRDKIALMKKNVIIVNEARGAVINENDITEAILSGRIAGFGCDVYSNEPFGKDHPYTKIKDKKNVILTPHCAWGAYEARARCVEIITKNIASFINGEKLNRVEI